MLRSIIAVVAAAGAIFAVVVVGTLLATLLLAGPDGSITGPYLAANLGVSFASASLGGWLAARLAPSRPLAHALAVAALIALLSLPGVLAPLGGQPAWYPIVLLISGVSGVGCGALLFRNRERPADPLIRRA